MQIDHNSVKASMKTVFTIHEDLRRNPSRVEKTQKLTLNKARPYMGLSGRYGLFASDEWWRSIASGHMSVLRIVGIIESAYIAGQDHREINTLDVRLVDGREEVIGIYVHEKKDLELFKVGHLVSIEYALDEFKPTPQGEIDFSRTALEMAVSTGVVSNMEQP